MELSPLLFITCVREGLHGELVAGRCSTRPNVNALVLPTQKQVTLRSHACEIQQARQDFPASPVTWILHEAYFFEQMLAPQWWCLQLCASLSDISFNNQRLSLVSKSSQARQRRHLCPSAVGKLLQSCSQGKMKHCFLFLPTLNSITAHLGHW